MPFGGALLRTPATWLAAPLAAASVLYTFTYPPATPDPYPVALTAAGSVTLGFVTPVVAALAAWETGRLRRANWWNLPHVRPPWLAAMLLALPAIAAGSIAVTAAIAAANLLGGAWLPDLRVLGLSYAVIAAHGFAGAAIGMRMPPIMAAPVALFAFYLWMAFPRALDPLWIRHLNGSLSSCCQLSADLAPAALLASMLVVAGITASAVGATWRPSAQVPLTAAVPVITSLILGSAAVYGMGPDPATARSAGLLICERGSVQVCVWPEHRALLDSTVEYVDAGLEIWAAAGIERPNLVTEQTGAAPDAITFALSPSSGRWDIIHSLAYGVIGPLPACEAEPYLGGDAVDYLLSWLDSLAGMPPGELVTRFGYEPPPGEPSVLEVTNELSSIGVAAQKEWFERNVAAVRACDVRASLDPAQ